MKITYNEELLVDKYIELKTGGEAEGFLDERHFGLLKMYINKKPQIVMFSFTIDEDEIFVGTD